MADKVTTSLAEAKILVMQGMKGDTGYSPQIEVKDIDGGHQIRITTKTSATQYETQVFNVLDGKDGKDGADGKDAASYWYIHQSFSASNPASPSDMPVNSYTYTGGNRLGTGWFSELDPSKVYFIYCFANMYNPAVRHYQVFEKDSGNIYEGYTLDSGATVSWSAVGGGGGGSDYDPDEELAKAYKLTVYGTTVTLNDTAVNVSAAIQSARPVLFYTESGGSFTFFDVSSMNYSTGEIKLRTPYDSENAQSVTLRPSGSTMIGTLETTDLSAEIADIYRDVYALTVSGTTVSLDTSIKDFYDKYSMGLTPAIYLPYGGAATDPIAMEMRLAYIDMLQNSITLVGEHGGNRYEVTLTGASYTASPMTGTLVTTPIVTPSDISGKADKIPRIAKAATDTVATIEPNKLYVFPEMASLEITLAAITDNTIVNEYHFIFTSGATATTTTFPAIPGLDGFAAEADTVYEVSILEGRALVTSWEVSAS